MGLRLWKCLAPWERGYLLCAPRPDLQVVGECPGDKRKAEHISTSQADEDECTGEEKPVVSAQLERKTLASDRELALLETVEAYVPPGTFENRKALLVDT